MMGDMAKNRKPSMQQIEVCIDISVMIAHAGLEMLGIGITTELNDTSKIRKRFRTDKFCQLVRVRMSEGLWLITSM